MTDELERRPIRQPIIEPLAPSKGSMSAIEAELFEKRKYIFLSGVLSIEPNLATEYELDPFNKIDMAAYASALFSGLDERFEGHVIGEGTIGYEWLYGPVLQANIITEAAACGWVQQNFGGDAALRLAAHLSTTQDLERHRQPWIDWLEKHGDAELDKAIDDFDACAGAEK